MTGKVQKSQFFLEKQLVKFNNMFYNISSCFEIVIRKKDLK